MPPISSPFHHSHTPQSAQSIPPPSSLFIPLMISTWHLFLPALFVAVCLFLFLFIRLLMNPSTLPTAPPPPNLPTSYASQSLQSANITKPGRPQAKLITTPPELQSLPTPTIRRHSYSHDENATSNLPPTPKITHVQSWPDAGDFVRRETMENLNGCQRHVVVFRRRN